MLKNKTPLRVALIRCSYVKRKTYLSLLRKIKKQCNQIGVKLNIYYRPIIWRRYGEGPNFGECRGNYSVKKKTISVVFYGKIGSAKKLEILLHELRHALHHHQGLYKDYYQAQWEDLPALKRKKKLKLPCRKTARLAEMDCNKFAYYWLKKEGIKIPKDFKYQGKTMADLIHFELYKGNFK